MLLRRLIAPQWLMDEAPDTRKVREGEFTASQIEKLNLQGYNVYFMPNYPSIYERGTTVDGSMIDTFEYVFVDMDLKDGAYASKDAFIEALGLSGILPSRIIDTGNGVHAYWSVSDLDVMSYLKLSRRLMRKFNTDPAVGQIFQLMRMPGTLNTKEKGNFKPCESWLDTDLQYTCEQLDNLLPPLTHDDDTHCQQHFQKTYKVASDAINVDTKLPLKFAKLLANNREVKDIWSGNTDDRSKSDWRLAHIMLAHGFTTHEALSTLVNSAKALGRAPIHKLSYAQNIIDKVWTAEIQGEQGFKDLSKSVRDILSSPLKDDIGKIFPCHKYLDNTVMGFRLGHLIGLAAGSGVGKTAVSLNMFMGFVENNPNYDHMFFSLEQPDKEIAEIWERMSAGDVSSQDKVRVIGNYDDENNYRHLGLQDIKKFIEGYEKARNRKVGCVVIDHLGLLKKDSSGKNKDEKEVLMETCQQAKALAQELQIMLVLQSQVPREKSGIGDLEINKDAAYGSTAFECNADYLITLWQPLKRCYPDGAPLMTAYKFCKIRHKRQKRDVIQEDVRYTITFDSDSGLFRLPTQDEETSFKHFNDIAANLRKQDRKTEVVPYTSVKWEEPTAAEVKVS